MLNKNQEKAIKTQFSYLFNYLRKKKMLNYYIMYYF